MSQTAFTDHIDRITVEVVRDLTRLGAPCVSVYLPTHRALPDRRHDALVLRGLLDEAAAKVREAGSSAADADDLLAPLRELLEDRPFWGEQGDGLALFAAPGEHRVLKLAAAPDQRVTVGECAHVVPLAALADKGGEFVVLALSLGRVRLFGARQGAIHEMDLGPIPARLEEGERYFDREPQLQHQHAPRASGAATFHGHGGTEVGDVVVNGFIRQVADGLRARLGAADRTPVVLASVAEYHAVLRESGAVPTLLGEVIAGNPDATTPAELLERALPIVERSWEADREQRLERVREALATGRSGTNAGELAQAAQEGRIGTLLVDPRAGASVDALVRAALGTGADLVVTPLPDGAPATGLMRY